MIGIDLVFIPEFKKQMELGGSSFLTRAFHPEDMKNQNIDHLAGLWAVKEAVIKAAGLGVEDWLKIKISRDASDRPAAIVGEQRFEISIAHHGDYAVAVAQAAV